MITALAQAGDVKRAQSYPDEWSRVRTTESAFFHAVNYGVTVTTTVFDTWSRVAVRLT
jgi:hypothetical protein